MRWLLGRPACPKGLHTIRSCAARPLIYSCRTRSTTSDLVKWHRWHKLDTKDESERIEFCHFLATLEEKFDSPNDPDDAQSTPIFLDRPHRSSITFPTEARTPCISNLLQDLMQGKQLSLQCIENILVLVTPCLEAEPNIVRLGAPSANQRVTVVGDLHGSLVDLAYLLRLNGMPSPDNVYIFNGDFVDRGPFGLEVLMTILACKAAQPDAVFLNRGNHEDRLLCAAYGFHSEVLQKANKRIFRSICEVFALMPLMTVIEEVALVVHGGLPSNHTPHELFEAVESIPRFKWQSMQKVDLNQLSQKEQRQFQLLKDLLWSDPCGTINGTMPSPRGAGCLFGFDVARNFLDSLDLQHLVRSHQCILNGFETTALGDGREHHTIFSASDYCRTNNLGAILVFSEGEDGHIEREQISWKPPAVSNVHVVEALGMVVSDTVSKIQSALNAAYFESGLPPVLNAEECARITETALGVPIPWRHIVEIATNEQQDEVESVDFEAFLDNYEDFVRTSGQLSFEGVHMYKQMKLLQAVFNYFDRDQDGIVSREDWLRGCTLLNAELPPEQRFNGERFFEIMDMTGNGVVYFNELCEGFRISNLKPPVARAKFAPI